MNVECDIEIFFFKFKEEEEVGGDAERSRGTVEEQRRRIVARRPIENPVYTVRQKFQTIFVFLTDIFKVMNQGATNGEGQGGRRPFQTPPIHQRTFSGDVGAPVPKQRYFNNPGKKAKVSFFRTQHPHLRPSNQLSQPPNGRTNIQPSAGQSLYATQPSAPPSPSFTPLSPSTPFSPSMPPGAFPQDPRLPSLYLPSYDEAVNMQ